jgi:hypothetical protein
MPRDHTGRKWSAIDLGNANAGRIGACACKEEALQS